MAKGAGLSMPQSNVTVNYNPHSQVATITGTLTEIEQTLTSLRANNAQGGAAAAPQAQQPAAPPKPKPKITAKQRAAAAKARAALAAKRKDAKPLAKTAGA